MDEADPIQPNPDPTGQSNAVPDPDSPTEINPKRAFEMAAETVEQPNPLSWMPPEPEELASLFPEYKIEHLLGRGGMGAVYKATQIILDRFVAIKLLPPELARADPNFAERFHREAKAMAALNHQNIVTVYNFGQTTAGHYYFVMEFVDGMDFHKLIHSGQLSEAGALNAVSQICDALEYAHEQGYVHRDIKPANIFINQKGILKIGDFGLAKIAKGNPQDFTQSSMRMGSLFYSAPEQVEGRPVDRRADIYSLGVMFYEMLTRDLPRGNFPLPSERVQIDVRLDHVVLKAMASEPERRYATATALRTEVDVIRTTQRQPPPGAQSVSAKPGKKIAKRGKKTSRHPAIITSLLGLLVVMIGTIVFLQNKGSKDPLAKEVGMTKPATPAVAAATTPSPNPAAVSNGEWIDLLALVDPDKDSLTGKWTRVKDGLHGEKLPEAKGAQHLQLPYEVPEEYDFRMTLTHLEGNCEATQILSAGDRQFIWGTTSGQPEKWAGFNMIKGKPMMLNGAGVKLPGPREVNRRYESLVEVRRDRVTGYVDGQKLVEWKTDYRDITPDPGYVMPNPKALGVGIWWSKTVFHEIAVREVTGKGKVLRSAAEPQASGTTTTATKDAPYINTLGMKFVPVPGTDVLFCIHETRYKDYAVFAGDGQGVDDSWKAQSADGFTPSEDNENHPVMKVSWEDAQNFCDWISQKEGNLYRLPTDEEWSIAAGLSHEEQPSNGPTPGIVIKSPTKYPWGDQWSPPIGSGNFSDESRKAKAPFGAAHYLDGYDDGFPTTAPVMGFKPNQFGIYDLEGNVREWCMDWIDQGETDRVLRGSCWHDGDRAGAFLFSITRSRHKPSTRHYHFGFRAVLVSANTRSSAAVSAPEEIQQTPAPSAVPSPAATKDAPFINTLGMKFVPVPIIGGPTDQQHLPFSVWETRVQDYEAFVKETNRARPAPDFAQTGLHPVVNLRYEDAVAFCAWLTDKERKAGKLDAHQRYRLPTDHEWTCAAGLGKAEEAAATPEAKNWKIAMYPWGRQYPPPVGAGNYYGAETKTNPAGNNVTSLESYNDGFERTAPVGSFAANELGLHDLGGNVSEWCADWFDGVKATKRVLRGASWGFHYSNDLLSSNRYGVAPNFWNLDVGFRIVLDSLTNPTGMEATAPAAPEPVNNLAEPGFVPLLEAPQLAGWREHGPGGGVSVTDSVVTLKPGRNFSGAWWYGARTFSDFQLRLQFRLASPGANSGVMLRFARRDEKKEQHYDVDISNDPNPLERTGAIMFVKAPTANPQKDGEWNDLDITAAGQSYRVLVNGILVNEYTGDRSTSGYIGLQLGRGIVQIRQLRINDLSAAPTLTIPPPNSEAAAKVVRLRSDFQAEAKSLDAPILALNTKYREYLETQKTAFQQAGNLKGVLAVDEELKRFEGTATGRADSPFSELKRLQEIYYKQKIELRQKTQDQYINLVRVYRQKAEDMASESTKAGRIEEAKQALAESDKFTAMEKAGNAPP